MKHVYIYTNADLYSDVKDTIEETNLEKAYGDKTFLTFENHKEVSDPHSDSIHAFIGTENDSTMIVAEY